MLLQTEPFNHKLVKKMTLFAFKQARNTLYPKETSIEPDPYQ